MNRCPSAISSPRYELPQNCILGDGHPEPWHMTWNGWTWVGDDPSTFRQGFPPLPGQQETAKVGPYRTGGHWRRTIVRVGTQPPDADGRRPDDFLVCTVDSAAAELAERICELLNADAPQDETAAAMSEDDCDCGHDGLEDFFHLRPCPVAERRFARRTRCPRCGGPGPLHDKWGVCVPCAVAEGWIQTSENPPEVGLRTGGTLVATSDWVYTLTLSGEERHIFVLLPGQLFPPDPLAICGKLVRYRLRSQPWAEQIPVCRLCEARVPR